MKTNLTIVTASITIPLAGETEAGSAQVQPARDSQLGHRRNVVAAVSHSRDCCIRQDISEISPMPKKTSLPKARYSLNRKGKMSNSR